MTNTPGRNRAIAGVAIAVVFLIGTTLFFALRDDTAVASPADVARQVFKATDCTTIRALSSAQARNAPCVEARLPGNLGWMIEVHDTAIVGGKANVWVSVNDGADPVQDVTVHLVRQNGAWKYESQGTGVQAQCQKDVALVASAAAAFHAKNGYYPDDIVTLVTEKFLDSDPGDVTYTSASDSTKPPTLEATGC